MLFSNQLGNVQISYDASGEGVCGFAQTIRVPSYRGRSWSNRHITFIVAKKA